MEGVGDTDGVGEEVTGPYVQKPPPFPEQLTVIQKL